MKNVNVRKLALAGILVAVGIVCSPLSIPVGASKCAPVQHFINILGGVFLGPGYAVGMAFVTSLLRNLMGTGTLLAFPGSMCGALLCGLVFSRTGKPRCIHINFLDAGGNTLRHRSEKRWKRPGWTNCRKRSAISMKT